jgi:hypothetical protein
MQSANQNLARYEDLHKTHIPNDVSPRTSARSFPASK